MPNKTFKCTDFIFIFEKRVSFDGKKFKKIIQSKEFSQEIQLLPFIYSFCNFYPKNLIFFSKINKIRIFKRQADFNRKEFFFRILFTIIHMNLCIQQDSFNLKKKVVHCYSLTYLE